MEAAMYRRMRYCLFTVFAVAVLAAGRASAGTPYRVYNELQIQLEVRFTDQFGNVARIFVAPGRPFTSVFPQGLTPGPQSMVVLDPGGFLLKSMPIYVPPRGALIIGVPSGQVRPVPFLLPV
jgi:hypothetical protein